MQLELCADDRKVAEHRALDAVLGARVALQNEPEDRSQQQQQREQREESVVGDQRRLTAGTIIRELLPDRDRDRKRGS